MEQHVSSVWLGQYEGKLYWFILNSETVIYGALGATTANAAITNTINNKQPKIITTPVPLFKNWCQKLFKKRVYINAMVFNFPLVFCNAPSPNIQNFVENKTF